MGPGPLKMSTLWLLLFHGAVLISYGLIFPLVDANFLHHRILCGSLSRRAALHILHSVDGCPSRSLEKWSALSLGIPRNFLLPIKICCDHCSSVLFAPAGIVSMYVSEMALPAHLSQNMERTSSKQPACFVHGIIRLFLCPQDE